MVHRMSSHFIQDFLSKDRCWCCSINLSSKRLCATGNMKVKLIKTLVIHTVQLQLLRPMPGRRDSSKKEILHDHR